MPIHKKILKAIKKTGKKALKKKSGGRMHSFAKRKMTPLLTPVVRKRKGRTPSGVNIRAGRVPTDSGPGTITSSITVSPKRKKKR